MTGHDEIIKRLREEIESLKLERQLLYDRMADQAIRETKLTLEVSVLRDAIRDSLAESDENDSFFLHIDGLKRAGNDRENQK